jgi:anaerobic ribonucleoside-triphosphate reductase activating protein
MRMGAVVEVTEAEGPGRRFALWVQGCSLRCPGCCNPHLFERDGGREVPVDELAARIEAVRAQIEGITLLGGEPFEQAGELAVLTRHAHALGLSVMAFSGYTLEELRARPDALSLLAEIDLLVDGRYEASLPERERRWAGSANQRFHFLSERYATGIERAGPAALRTVEIALGGGRLRANGWPALLGLHRRG